MPGPYPYRGAYMELIDIVDNRLSSMMWIVCNRFPGTLCATTRLECDALLYITSEIIAASDLRVDRKDYWVNLIAELRAHVMSTGQEDREVVTIMTKIWKNESHATGQESDKIRVWNRQVCSRQVDMREETGDLNTAIIKIRTVVFKYWFDMRPGRHTTVIPESKTELSAKSSSKDNVRPTNDAKKTLKVIHGWTCPNKCGKTYKSDGKRAKTHLKKCVPR